MQSESMRVSTNAIHTYCSKTEFPRVIFWFIDGNQDILDLIVSKSFQHCFRMHQYLF